MLYTIDEIKKRVLPVVQKYNIPEIYLFGSYSRNEATIDSDIDLAIDSTPLCGLLQLQAFRDEIYAALDRSVDVLTLSAIHAEKHNPLKQDFLQNFSKERIRLYE